MQLRKLTRGKKARWAAAALALLAGAALRGQSANTDGVSPAEEAALRAAMEWVRTTPPVRGNYEYDMTARIRLLFFWVTRSDVGGGTIRRGAIPQDPQRELISLLIGSDPAKAKTINRWGAAMEVVQHAPDEARTPQTSVFFGFMTRAKAEESTEEAKERIEREKSKKEFQYQAMVSRLDRQQGIAKTVPFATEKELDIYQFAPMKEKVFTELAGGAGKYRGTPAALQQKCPRVGGFLASVAELVDGALERGATKGTVCYIHYGELYTLKLIGAKAIREKTVRVEMKTEPKLFEHTYQNLLDTEFQIFNHQTGKKTEF
ncbi:MAG TPA: hypothetical protein VGQ11_08240, partial [Candidatus Acidoferrales bacterium]|nr:hypothetical protein [Candidatus Acidoferrales bacterium]